MLAPGRGQAGAKSSEVAGTWESCVPEVGVGEAQEGVLPSLTALHLPD